MAFSAKPSFTQKGSLIEITDCPGLFALSPIAIIVLSLDVLFCIAKTTPQDLVSLIWINVPLIIGLAASPITQSVVITLDEMRGTRTVYYGRRIIKCESSEMRASYLKADGTGGRGANFWIQANLPNGRIWKFFRSLNGKYVESYFQQLLHQLSLGQAS